ncbi:MAG: regulatory protein RecX [Ruminococcaceae bacterium]|nr:regulatory protein RecX [Oscillospiraceae bacterium]
MRIEKLEKSNSQQGRVLVHLEGGDLLRITEEELLRFDLYTGLDISPEDVVKLKKCAAQSEARTRAAGMIAARPLSRKELQKRLCGKGAQEEDAAAAADWLEEIGALDDLAYAKMLVRRYSETGYGAARLRDELFRRGVPRELWDEALAEAIDPGEAIARIVASRTKGAPLDEKGRKRLADYLLRRGFSWNEVKPAISALGADIEEE